MPRWGVIMSVLPLPPTLQDGATAFQLACEARGAYASQAAVLLMKLSSLNEMEGDFDVVRALACAPSSRSPQAAGHL